MPPSTLNYEEPAKPPSKTNYTKRPGQQPHKQTVNNLRTAPGCQALWFTGDRGLLMGGACRLMSKLPEKQDRKSVV